MSNMNKSVSLSIAFSFLALVQASSFAQTGAATVPVNESASGVPGANCMHTNRTPIIPDGNIASKDELVSAKARIKAYQDNLLDFRECLLTAEKALDAESAGYADAIKQLGIRSDASIDLETRVAEEFNEAIKIYKSR